MENAYNVCEDKKWNIKERNERMQSIHAKRPRQSLLSSEGRRYVGRKIWKNRYIYLMTLPIIAYFILIRYVPMYWLRIAFYDYKLLRGSAGSKFVGLKHFQQFVTGMSFGQLISNTLSLNLLSLLFSFPFPIIFALFLNEIGSQKFKRTVQTISYLPHFLSTVVIVSMLNTLLSVQTGAVNGALRSMGLGTVYFMGEPAWFQPIYILSGIWQGTGWGAIIYISALSGINPELYEAARADGAGRFRQMWHVSLPGIRETIVIMLIMRVGQMMNIGFEKPFLMQNALNISKSEVISTYVYKLGLQRNDYSRSTAIGLFNAVISLALVLIANFTSRKLSDTSLF